MRPNSVASAFIALALAAGLAACAGHVYDSPIDCASCDACNQPQQPFRIAENSWYVGVAGPTAVGKRELERLERRLREESAE